MLPAKVFSMHSFLLLTITQTISQTPTLHIQPSKFISGIINIIINCESFLTNQWAWRLNRSSYDCNQWPFQISRVTRISRCDYDIPLPNHFHGSVSSFSHKITKVKCNARYSNNCPNTAVMKRPKLSGGQQAMSPQDRWKCWSVDV